MSEHTTLDRRTVLKTIGGASATAALGGSALLAATTPAAASASLNVNIDNTTYSGDQGDLDWVGVDAEKTIKWDGFDVPVHYIGFKHELSTDANKDGWHVLYGDGSGGPAISAHLDDWRHKDGGHGGTWASDDEYVSSHGGDKGEYLTGEAHAGVKWEIVNDGTWHDYGYANGGPQTPPEWASDLSESDDGATNTSTITWKTTLSFYTDDGGTPVQITGDDGVPEVVGMDDITVTVTNEGGQITSSSDGNTTSG